MNILPQPFTPSHHFWQMILKLQKTSFLLLLLIRSEFSNANGTCASMLFKKNILWRYSSMCMYVLVQAALVAWESSFHSFLHMHLLGVHKPFKVHQLCFQENLPDGGLTCIIDLHGILNPGPVETSSELSLCLCRYMQVLTHILSIQINIHHSVVLKVD